MFNMKTEVIAKRTFNRYLCCKFITVLVPICSNFILTFGSTNLESVNVNYLYIIWQFRIFNSSDRTKSPPLEMF